MLLLALFFFSWEFSFWDGGVLSVACSTSFGHCLVIFIIAHSRICISLFGAFVMNVYRCPCVCVILRLCVRSCYGSTIICWYAQSQQQQQSHYQQLHIEFHIHPCMHSDFDSLHTMKKQQHTLCFPLCLSPLSLSLSQHRMHVYAKIGVRTRLTPMIIYKP